jgi:hypothetical protein
MRTNLEEHDPDRTHWAPYMEWAQARPTARWDLAGSNLLHVEPCELLSAEPCELVRAEPCDLEGPAAALALHGSSSGGHPPLLDAIAAHYGATSDRVATATGASGANFLALAALLRPGDEVLFETPGYDPILGAARLLGAGVRRFERRFEQGWALDPERVEAALGPSTRVVAITNPHNPTGALVTEGALAALADLAERRDLWVLVDEVYLDSATFPGVFAEPAAARRLGELTVAGRGGRFVATSSLTKSYGLSGLRCGWAIAEPAVAAAMRRARGVVDAVAPMPTDALSVVAFAQLDRLARRAAELLAPNLRLLERWIESSAALAWSPPAGGTVAFPRVAGVEDTAPLCRALLDDAGIAVVPGALFGEPRHVRISFGGLRPDAFASALAELGPRLTAAETAGRSAPVDP